MAGTSPLVPITPNAVKAAASRTVTAAQTGQATAQALGALADAQSAGTATDDAASLTIEELLGAILAEVRATRVMMGKIVGMEDPENWRG